VTNNTLNRYERLKTAFIVMRDEDNLRLSEGTSTARIQPYLSIEQACESAISSDALSRDLWSKPTVASGGGDA
jgi:hypothetical protein